MSMRILFKIVKKIWAVFKLTLLFIRELFLSTWSVIVHVVKPGLHMQPGIIFYKTTLTSDLEITLLSSFVTLTPGTLTIDVSDDQQTLQIHVMHMDDEEKLKADIKNTFEKAIMEVTR